jgi:hypothetical protein
MLPNTSARLLHSHCDDGCEAIVIKEGWGSYFDQIHSRRYPLLQEIQDFGSGPQGQLKLLNLSLTIFSRDIAHWQLHARYELAPANLIAP